MLFTAAVEGPSDEAALKKILRWTGNELGAVHGRNGKDQIIKSLAGYNYAARFNPWIVLLDLDSAPCAATAKTQLLADPSPWMCLRLAVRELEAWLLADRDRFAAFFSVSPDLIPLDPEQLHDPKANVINIARRSRRSAIRADMVPNAELGQSVGPAYTTRIIEFIGSEDGWRVEVAAQESPSLRRAIEAIRRLAAQH